MLEQDQFLLQIHEFEEGTDLVRALDAGMRIDVTFVTDNMKVLISPEELDEAAYEIEG